MHLSREQKIEYLMLAEEEAKRTAHKVVINDAYWPVLDSSATYVDLWGGRGSGKSYFVGAQLVPLRASLIPNHKILVGRKVATTIRLSVWPMLMRGLSNYNLGDKVAINKTDRAISFPNGSEIFCVGFDDPEKLKSLEGIHTAWLEEAFEYSEEDFENLDAAMKCDFKQILMTHNPFPMMPEFPHWLKSRFIDKPNNKNLIIKTTYCDNIKFLPASYGESLESIKDRNPKLWDMWANGNFTTLEGVIFDVWDVVDKIAERAKFLGFGLDFGYSNDPAAFVEVWLCGKDLFLKERLYETGLTNQDLGNRFKDLEIKKIDEIIADSSEPKSIEEIYRMGYNIHSCYKGQDSVLHGINKMKEYSIHLIRGSTNLIKEFASYSWKTDKNGKSLAVPCDVNNHGIDAARYRVAKQPHYIGVGSK
jgi:phage terminase large subunit